MTSNADYFLSGQEPGEYLIEAENVGNQPTDNSQPVTLEDLLPAGTVPEKSALFRQDTNSAEARAIEIGACPNPLLCELPAASPALKPGEKLIMRNLLVIPEGVIGPLHDAATVSGGAPSAAASTTNAASPDPLFGTLHLDAALTDSSGNPYTQAGGHPYQFTTEFNFGTYSSLGRSGGGSSPLGDPREIAADLPPGLIANPQAVPVCSLAAYFNQECSPSTVVGDDGIRAFGATVDQLKVISPVYNLQTTGAYPGELGFTTAGRAPFAIITAGLRSGSDYGVTAVSTAPESDLTRVRLTFWGTPAAHSHDALRNKSCAGSVLPLFTSPEALERLCEKSPGSVSAEVKETPFLTMPTECSGRPLDFVGRYDSWQVPGEFAQRTVQFPAVDGCNQLSFQPKIEARPTTTLADSPSGFDFNLTVPQNEAVNGVATPSLKEAVVRLPAGLTVNPSSANGLTACSPAQIGLTTPVGTVPAHFTEAPAACPDASKLGSVEVNTQLLHNPLQGSVYLATPHQNPSGNLLAGYIVLEGEGIIVKLAGQFQTDQTTGQITASFFENPQTPFEDFKFHFFEGARGALRTPAVCGSYEVGSELTPWSHMEGEEEATPIAHPHAEFETTEGPQGGACPNAASEEPNKPVFHAGTETQQAAIYSPFSLKLVREDGSQELKAIDTTLPPGLVGKLAGVGECSDAALAAAADPHHSGAAEQATPSCPLNSEVGTVDVAAGAGPTPLNVAGHAYLAGPYKSAPLSLAIVTPAVAGPFDLGTVVVRTALYVNPETAQIHAVSDPIPTILEGIPLDVRSIALKMSRPNFTLNPTDCEPLAFTGSALSVLGVSAPLTQRFQVGGCPALKFKPGLKLSLKGGTKRHTFPALKAVITYPKKGAYANIASAQVTLPHSAFLEQGHIGTVCTRPQLASHTCPAKSIYGHATAVTPLLDKPLSGPVYLGVGFGHKLPDLVADLNGQIEVLLHGKVDTGREDGLRNTFEVVPDAPVSKFTLSMFGGKKGLIVNSENLCGPRAKTKALAQFVGQNGKSIKLEPTVANSCKKKGKGKKHGNAKRPSHRLGRSHR